ncbi:MAG: tetratricopeptide repeat protein [bacterium]
MLENREEINSKLNEYKAIISEGSSDYNTLNEILFFLGKYGFLAELRDALILYINNFLKDKPDVALIEYVKFLSIFPEDDEVFEKFMEFIKNTNIKQIEKNIYLKIYIKLLSTLGKFGKAINIVNEILNMDVNNIDNLILAANVYETEGHIDKAVELYFKAIEKTTNIEEKIKLREQISIIDPGNKENILELVDLYIQKKELESASKVFLSVNSFDLFKRFFSIS